MRLVIAEDEAVVARRLERMVREQLGTVEIEQARTYEAALGLVRGQRFDVLLLDLDLAGRDGFGLLEEAAAGAFQTVVVSARHEQALRAFEYGVVDFVPKPWTAERLAQALLRATGRERGAGGGVARLAVRWRGGLRSLAVADVESLRGADDYSEVHLADGSSHLHAKTLAALATILPPRFLRVHRSWIVDLERVRGLRTEAGARWRLLLASGAEVPVGRLYRDAVRERFGE